MNMKAIFWVGGAFVTAAGLVLGLCKSAKAVVPADNGEGPVRPPHEPADDFFSPDAFRDELLK